MSTSVIESKLRAVGNSTGVVLPKELLNDLSLEKGDTVFFVKNADGSYTLTPYDRNFKEQMEAALKGMKNYRNALRELAK